MNELISVPRARVIAVLVFDPKWLHTHMALESAYKLYEFILHLLWSPSEILHASG